MFHKTAYGLTAVTVVAVAGIGLAFVNGQAGATTPEPSGSGKLQVPDTYESMDTNQDFMVSSEEALAAMPNLNFEVADTNGDGQLSRVEHLDLMQKVADGTWTNTVVKRQIVKEIEGYDDNPVDVVNNAKKGTLRNPYDPANTTVAEEGHQAFQNHGCNSCHGGNGGGGMCPPVNNGVWIYGDSDDAMYRLITLGSRKLQEAGYSRMNPVTPALMPQQGGTTLKKSGDLWKIITWIRSINVNKGS